jgi:uncharacterized protein (DUF4415 family)
LVGRLRAGDPRAEKRAGARATPASALVRRRAHRLKHSFSTPAGPNQTQLFTLEVSPCCQPPLHLSLVEPPTTSRPNHHTENKREGMAGEGGAELPQQQGTSRVPPWLIAIPLVLLLPMLLPVAVVVGMVAGVPAMLVYAWMTSGSSKGAGSGAADAPAAAPAATTATAAESTASAAERKVRHTHALVRSARALSSIPLDRDLIPLRSVTSFRERGFGWADRKRRIASSRNELF